ncbi:hypothetical protein ACEPPN_001255 [Leptodophora sp. 'Broadleaf-Isolate-01']
MPSPLEVAIPSSNSTVGVSIIDTTSWALNFSCGELFLPRFPGLDTFDLCSYAFLVSTPDDRHVLFDLGIRKDWENLIPSTVAGLKDSGAEVSVEKELVDILRDGGIDPNKIEAAPHPLGPHGESCQLPINNRAHRGPGIKDRFLPGWPAVPDAHFHEADLAGRKITALEADSFVVDIGGLRGFDYFGNGSFYLFDAPEHSLGHMNALARTSSNPDTFIFMAADSVHLGGEFRPTEAVPLPDSIDVPSIVPLPCPSEELLKIHPRASRTLPYLGLDPCFPEHLRDAEKTIECVQRFDADDRVLVVFAHDVSIYKTLEYYPATANKWKDKGWKSTGQWAFLPHLQKIAKEHKKGTPQLAEL